jgi:hypothetical protein
LTTRGCRQDTGEPDDIDEPMPRIGRIRVLLEPGAEYGVEERPRCHSDASSLMFADGDDPMHVSSRDATWFVCVSTGRGVRVGQGSAAIVMGRRSAAQAGEVRAPSDRDAGRS